MAIFIVFVIMYMAGLNQWFCIGFGIVTASVLVWQTFALNAKYGEHGLMKVGAIKNHPLYIINRKPFSQLFKNRKQ